MTDLEPVIGRYARVEHNGQRLRVYFEEAGAGPVLLCLHTAGADSRQYRHLLNDPELTARFRVVAFDLPRHGRSLPPEQWWRQDYLLTTREYRDIVLSVVDALELTDPIVLGCSMGGSIVLELARSAPERIRAVIGMSGASRIEGRFADWAVRPDINENQVIPTFVYGLMAPQSPEEARREIWWIYSQGGSGTYRGDAHFYREDWDLRGAEAEIDTDRCPVHLLTGEYDHSCTPEETQATAARIPGAEFTAMPGIGHFPMSENYPLFRDYLVPVLDRITSRV